MLTEAPVEAWDGHIILKREPGTVTVTIAGQEVARSTRAVHFTEGDRAPVYYIPREDVALDLFATSDHSSRCRWKGKASYLHFDNGETRVENALWAYPEAHDEVAVIRDCVAFDLSHATVTLLPA